MEIGIKIKELRISKKITQEELAKALQVSTQAVSKWENGGCPDLELIPGIAAYFNVSTDYLFGVESSDFLDIEKKVCDYIASFPVKERFERINKLGYLMSIAINGKFDLSDYDYDNIVEENYHSEIENDYGTTVTSLQKSNQFFACFPKNDTCDFTGVLKSRDKQIELCKLLSDSVFYDALVFVYSRGDSKFTEDLFVNKFNISKEKALEILDGLLKFELVKKSNVELNDNSISIYEKVSIPHLVGLFAFLDICVEKPYRFYHCSLGVKKVFGK